MSHAHKFDWAQRCVPVDPCPRTLAFPKHYILTLSSNKMCAEANALSYYEREGPHIFIPLATEASWGFSKAFQKKKLIASPS